MNYTEKGFEILGKLLFTWFGLAVVVFFLTLIPFPKLGSMDAVKNANHEYQFKDGNFQNLVNDYYYVSAGYAKEKPDLWNLSSYHSECEIFSPNWKKVNSCIFQYKLCEAHLPLGKYKDNFHALEALEIYSEAQDNLEKHPEYKNCINSKNIKWTRREYAIMGLKILYTAPVLIVGIPIEAIFGTEAASFILGQPE